MDKLAGGCVTSRDRFFFLIEYINVNEQRLDW